MPGNNYVSIGGETTYGTPASGTYVGLAVDDDGHKSNVAVMQPEGIIYGEQGPSTEGRQTQELDAMGGFKTYLPSSGMLLPLQATFGDPEVVELVEDVAYKYIFRTSGAASLASLTAQVGRTFKSGGADRDTYAGGMVKEFRLNQAKPPTSGGVSADGLARIELDMDYQRRVPSFGTKLPTYPSPELYHAAGSGLKLWIGESLAAIDDDEDGDLLECVDSFGFKYPTAIVTEPDCITSILKDQPTRGDTPAPTIDMGWTYKNRTYYDAWIAGEVLALRALYEPVALEIAPDIKPSVQWDFAAFGLTDANPSMSKKDKTKQDLGSQILWNTVDPMITCTVISSDLPAALV